MPRPTTLPPEEAAALREWCRRLKWRVTDSRLAILKAALEAEGYFDAEQAAERARKFDRGISRATVYRALSQLFEHGFLHRTDVGDGPVRFCRVTPGEAVSAEICIEECGQILKVPAPFLQWYAASITNRPGLELVSQRFQTFARCTHLQSGGECANCPLEVRPPRGTTFGARRDSVPRAETPASPRAPKTRMPSKEG